MNFVKEDHTADNGLTELALRNRKLQQNNGEALPMIKTTDEMKERIARPSTKENTASGPPCPTMAIPTSVFAPWEVADLTFLREAQAELGIKGR